MQIFKRRWLDTYQQKPMVPQVLSFCLPKPFVYLHCTKMFDLILVMSTSAILLSSL